MTWKSKFEHPPPGKRVLVWLEQKDNPPELNAPGRLGFGHHIPPPSGLKNSEHWPENGWFFSGPDYLMVEFWHELPEEPRK